MQDLGRLGYALGSFSGVLNWALSQATSEEDTYRVTKAVLEGYDDARDNASEARSRG